MDKLQPVLFGWNVKELWDYIHPVSLVGWAILILAPRWKPTYTIATLVPPFLHASLYSAILLPIMLFPNPSDPVLDINNMESVMSVLGMPNVFFCAWVHYLVFDLLVARGMAMDAVETCGVSYLQYYTMVVPCLVATLYVGPVGFLVYMILRGTGLLRASTMLETTGEKKHS
jgi:Domain of unknown function (DUF4281)